MNNKYKAALKQLLYSLDYTTGWPHIRVSIGLDEEFRTVWVTGRVDDETREAIRNAEKCLGD